MITTIFIKNQFIEKLSYTPANLVLLAISGKEKLFVKEKLIIICFKLRNIFFHKSIMGENSTPSRFLKERHWSTKSDVSRLKKEKLLTGKVGALLMKDSRS